MPFTSPLDPGSTGGAPPVAPSDTRIPAISVDPPQAALGGVVTVRGFHWPENAEVRLTLSEFRSGSRFSMSTATITSTAQKQTPKASF